MEMPINGDRAGKVTLMMTILSAGIGIFQFISAGMEDETVPNHESLDTERAWREEQRLCYVGITSAEKKMITYQCGIPGYGAPGTW